MADSNMLNTLKSLLGDNADEKIGAVMDALKNSSGNGTSGSSMADNINSVLDSVSNSIEVNDDHSTIPVSFSPTSNSQNTNDLFSPEGLAYMSKIKGIIDEMGSANDSRSNLLMSLKPYMRTNRQKSIDNAVKLLNLSRFAGLFKI